MSNSNELNNILVQWIRFFFGLLVKVMYSRLAFHQ